MGPASFATFQASSGGCRRQRLAVGSGPDAWRKLLTFLPDLGIEV